MSSPVQVKQIRFVNTSSQPPTKRRRVNAACFTCRKRKTRCDGRQPLCLTCEENGHECLGFAPDASDRKKSFDATRSGEEYKDGSRDTGRRPSSQLNDKTKHSSTSPEKRPSLRDSQSYNLSEDIGRRGDATAFPTDSDSLHSQNVSHRVPYFRYFGPTAIVPGFKQMVVSVREHRKSIGAGSAIPMSPRSSMSGSTYGKTPPHSGMNSGSCVDLPMYDQTDPLPVNRLIINLVGTFFTHLGCNFPFLRQNSFTQMVEERLAETILVDAVCSLAARFSDHPLLTAGHGSLYPKSEYGHVYAQRAKAAVVDTFPCPSVSAVQACLLLAYEGFGSNQDSALWMFLGCSIRMAVDLGLQKLDGVRHQGQKDPQYHRSSIDDNSDVPTPISAQEKMEVEQERMDTLWTVFMLDRVISSGTGRSVTLRDEDFELSFPAVTPDHKSGWPNPFPALIQIIHLYGRVSDLLNNIRDVQDVTTKKIEGLSAMEKDLTSIYQKLDQRLTFNAENFQHYVKAGEGTNFILVHFWFHTLIMLLHQPTLMHSFEGQILQLLPNSRELSMSSAKTIADILAFAELIDPKSFIGNPFTSQPIYIAACAFLMESAIHTVSQPTSRDTSPPKHGTQTRKNGQGNNSSEKKHSLLASVANQNYQRCYKALQQLEVYWAGTRYILVALDQKAKGIWDPETYTDQEYESTKINNDLVPVWRRKILAAAPSPGKRFPDLARSPRPDTASPSVDPSQAIGWSLTGTTNSPSSNLTFMYQNLNGEVPQDHPPPIGVSNMKYDPIRQSLSRAKTGSGSNSNQEMVYKPLERQQWTEPQSMAPPGPKYTPIASDSAATSDAEILLSLNSPVSQGSNSRYSVDRSSHLNSPPISRQEAPFNFSPIQSNIYAPSPINYGLGGVGDMMMMESQEIDVSNLGGVGGDMMPWLDYLPQDVLQFFDGGHGDGMHPSSGSHGEVRMGRSCD